MPLVGVVTRLTHQKGIHLIKHAAWRTLERGGQFVLLGSAPDPRVQVRLPCHACLATCCISYSPVAAVVRKCLHESVLKTGQWLASLADNNRFYLEHYSNLLC